MTCQKCKYEFCWVCLKDWSDHRNNYSCNRFRDSRVEDQIRKNRSRQTLKDICISTSDTSSMKLNERRSKNFEKLMM